MSGRDAATEPTDDAPERGTAFAGAVVRERLGEGRLGFHLRGEAAERPVAIHALRRTATEDERRRFRHAVDRLSEATHHERPSGILAPLVIETGRRLGFSTRLCTAGTLEDLPTLGWPLQRKLEMVAKVAELLEWLHQRGLTHGALSPSAVLLDDELEPWLAGIDGLNLALGTPGDSDEPRARAAYASPEARGGGPLDARSDVFSLGRILYFVLVDAHPGVDDEHLAELERRRVSPPGLVRIVRTATARAPEQRYRTVDALLFDLGRCAVMREGGSLLPPRYDRRRASAPPPSAEGSPPLSIPPPDLPPQLRGSVVGIGFLGLLAACFLAYGVGTDPGARDLTDILFAVGAGALTLAVPLRSRWTLALRAALAVATVAAVWALGPSAITARVGARARLHAAAVDQRAAAVRYLVRAGERDLAGLNLAGARLEGLPLDGASLVGARLEDADLRGADLRRVDLTGAVLSNALLAEADLEGSNLAEAIGVETARCDDLTRLPPPASCVDGRISLSGR